jgi:hypothetical protein
VSRVTSGFFVSALMRRVTAAGGFAAIMKKGAEEAGAVFIVKRERHGSICLYAPAAQAGYQESQSQERQFQLVEHVTDDTALSTFEMSENRFDPDFWLVELELSSEMPDLFAIMKL